MTTLGESIERRETIEAHCKERRCGHAAKLDLPKLAEKLGRDHGTLHKDLVPHLKCGKCGSKNIGLTLTPYYGESGGYPGHLGGGR
jgi:ribosomal protein L37E